MTFSMNFAATQARRQTHLVQFLVTGWPCGLPPLGEIPKPSLYQCAKVEVFHAVEIRRGIIMTQNCRGRKFGGVVPIHRAIGGRRDHNLVWIDRHYECGSKRRSGLSNLTEYRCVDPAALCFDDQQGTFVWFSNQHVYCDVRQP